MELTTGYSNVSANERTSATHFQQLIYRFGWNVNLPTIYSEIASIFFITSQENTQSVHKAVYNSALVASIMRKIQNFVYRLYILYRKNMRHILFVHTLYLKKQWADICIIISFPAAIYYDYSCYLLWLWSGLSLTKWTLITCEL